MTWLTKRNLTIIALVAAAIWFFGLRGTVGNLLLPSLPVYQGQIDELDRLVQAQAMVLAYSPADLNVWFGKSTESASPIMASAIPAQTGDTSEFWVSDVLMGDNYRVSATLRFAGQQVLMYVDNNITVDQQALEQAAIDFETRILPQTRVLFGSEAPTGLDGDARLTILHTPLASAAGYFSHADFDPLEINRFSNQRKMIVIGSDSYMPGDEGYLKILAHEFQHMIHANQQPYSSAWFNEGMSMLAEDLNGYPNDELAMIYLANPDISLTDWSQDASVTGEHYGAAQLFLRYFYEQYGTVEILPQLLLAGAGDQPQVFSNLAAQTRPDIYSFTDLVADWAAANVLKDASLGDGRYAYESLPARVSPIEFPGGDLIDSVNQLGVDYWDVGMGPLRLEFDGEDAVALTGAHPKRGQWMWWSGRVDARMMTLTRAFDLREVNQATLEFSTWYELEQHYDYAYVTVSVDGGHTWQTMSGRHTSHEDPKAPIWVMA
jgi:immune inhibitor A